MHTSVAERQADGRARRKLVPRSVPRRVGPQQ